MSEDVTTRGNYYPDKSMATAAVSRLPRITASIHADVVSLEPPALPTRHQHHKRWPREGGYRD